MDWTKHKEEITAIIELVEDKNFPARRNILDYVESIFGYPKDMATFIEVELAKLNTK